MPLVIAFVLPYPPPIYIGKHQLGFPGERHKGFNKINLKSAWSGTWEKFNLLSIKVWIFWDCFKAIQWHFLRTCFNIEKDGFLFLNCATCDLRTAVPCLDHSSIKGSTLSTQIVRSDLGETKGPGFLFLTAFPEACCYLLHLTLFIAEVVLQR